jgi:trans-aconitate methyltransferase
MLVEKLKIYGYILKLTLHKRKRTSDIIKSEYNDGLWNRTNENSASTINKMYNKKDDETGLFVNDKIFLFSTYKNQAKKYWNQILTNLSDYKNSEVVELGCGLGANLFQLEKNGFKNLHGFDISENAILLARKNNENNTIKFNVLDMTHSLPDFTNKIIFTHACLEQLKHSMKTVIQNIVDSNPKLVINFEVNYDNSPFMVRKYFDALDYQNNLVRELNKNMNVEIISIQKFPVSLSAVNRLSCIIWKTIK